MNARKIAKAVALYGLWPALVTVTVLEWVHFPAVKPLSTWLESFGGLWSALQGIGIPLSIFMALYLPVLQKKNNDLARLVAHRNIAFFVERFVRKAVAPEMTQGKLVPQWTQGYKTCLDEFSRLDRSEINPPRLIENLVDFANYAWQVYDKMLCPAIKEDDKNSISIAEEKLTANIAKIDEYLKSRSVTFDSENIAHL